jgi:hypothetical protein
MFSLCAALLIAYSSGANCTIKEGVDIGTSSIDEFKNIATVNDCCSKCLANPRCLSFSFATDRSNNNGSSANCYLKDNAASSRAEKNRVSGTVPARPAPSPAPSPPQGPVMLTLSNEIISRTNDRYVSWTIDTSRGRQFFDLDFTNSTLRYLASQIPTVMRIGGSGGDYLTYDLGNTTTTCGDSKHNCLNASQYDSLMGFAKAADVQIVFALNICPRKNTRGENTFCDAGKPTAGHWDSTNAEEFLRYSIAKEFKFFGLELGNERDSEQNGASQAADFRILSDLLAKLYPDTRTRPFMIGPDPHSIRTVDGTKKTAGFLADFIKATTALGVEMHAITHHEYIEIDEQSVFNGSYLDTSAGIAVAINRTVKQLLPSAEVWGGEIG